MTVFGTLDGAPKQGAHFVFHSLNFRHPLAHSWLEYGDDLAHLLRREIEISRMIFDAHQGISNNVVLNLMHCGVVEDVKLIVDVRKVSLEIQHRRGDKLLA